ncbi:beta-lactamase domain-containing protein [Alicycliphilus sp. B1]|nr:beta-lactamase domain-containing protein [Alicycliphilus sp. B1]
MLVDSGYCAHAAQTVALVESGLQGRPLDRLLNTHLHSDHCGGNAALQARWPRLITHIPPGQWDQVQAWDPVALSYEPTGQDCPRFRADGRLMPGSELTLGGSAWQVHAAPGHDPHAVLLFEPRARVLISGDALWENGFGVVFPELDGAHAFADVGATLDLIEQLDPLTVIPGHGSVFGGVPAAIARARRRLAGFEADPIKHARHAAKVLLKYKLLEWQQAPLDAGPSLAGRHAVLRAAAWPLFRRPQRRPVDGRDGAGARGRRRRPARGRDAAQRLKSARRTRCHMATNWLSDRTSDPLMQIFRIHSFKCD